MEKILWESQDLPQFKALNQNIETEVLVIGGGICGILCAYRLSKNNKKVVLVEADRICAQKTKRTTAVITALQDIYYNALIHQFGKKKAQAYLKANLMAIEEYSSLAKKFDFDFERVSSYKYAIEDTKGLEKEIKALASLGYHASLKKDIGLPFEIAGAIEFKNQAQMNPLKLVNCLLPSFTVYENTRIVDIKDTTAYTEEYEIKAQKIIVCTGYPFLRLKGMHFMKTTQEKSYVVVTKNNVNGFCGNAIGDKPYELYVRSYQDKLIIGGNDQKTGKDRKGYLELERLCDSMHTKKEYNWVNQDCITLDGLPYIGRYTANSHNLLVATGFNLWGMTASMISSILLTDLVLGRKNEYEDLFSPQRKMPIIPLLKNIGTAVIFLLIPKRRRCNHLGCALTWNKTEQVYECPCHGSKFTKNGDIIHGPTQKAKDL